MSDRLLEGGGLRQGNSVGHFEGHFVVWGMDDWEAALDEKGVNWAPGVKDVDTEGDRAGANDGGFEPVDGRDGLGVTGGGVAFKFIYELIPLLAELVEFWAEGEITYVTFRGDNQRGENFFQLWGLEKKVGNLAVRHVHNGIMDEDGLDVWNFV